MDRFFRQGLFPLIVIVLLVYLASQTILDGDPTAREMTYAEAQALLRDHPERIEEITLRPRKREAVVELADGTSGKTARPEDSGTPIWWTILTVLPFALVIGIWIFRNRSRRRAEEDLSSQVRNRSTA